MNACMLTVVLAGFATLGSDKKEHSPPTELQVPTTPIGLAVFLSNIDEHKGRISIDNGRVVVNTPSINAVVAKGLDCIPSLLIIMKDEEVDSDLFIRCYSSCDQMLRAIDSHLGIWWDGSAIRDRGSFRISFGFIDADGLEAFKKKVIADIEKKYAVAKKKKSTQKP